MKRYNHSAIEKKWQKEWTKKKVYRALNTSKKKKKYVLDMFPYPSGAGLHVGHPKGYIGSDVYARMKRMQGFNVLHPMGYDAFGLPAEQYAVTHNIHPRKAVLENVKTFESQLSVIGLSYDWDRKVNTTDPDYYQFTQRIFLEIYNSWYDKSKNKAQPIESLIKRFAKEGNKEVNAVTDENTPIFTSTEWKAKTPKEKQDVLMRYRLAYDGFAEVNWCPELGTVLANDEVLDGPNGTLVSERGGFPVEKKQMRQWFMRITAYGDRLLSGLDTLDWPNNIKEIQRNWIGKSEGAEIEFKVESSKSKVGDIKIFTTRADTLFGATYIVLAPEHPLVEKLLSHIENISEVIEYKTSVQNKALELRTDGTKEKTGVQLKGVSATNPVNGEMLPIWIADYVLASYGTGAVMAVPAHDERDFEFAEKYNLPIREVVSNNDTDKRNASHGAYTGTGILINSGEFSGITDEEARKVITQKANGNIVTKYKMRNAIFARQRYWGEPIPLSYDTDGIIHEVSKLPLTLPDVKSYQPTGTGESPLASVPAWVKKGYETNTMPGWAGSSWYFLRYMDPKNKKEIASKKALSYWGQVDMYVGGAEHATGHLLYSRFWNMFLKDIGVAKFDEPFKTLRNQGMIQGADGRKMSKRWGNVINPDDIVKMYGADTLRVYEMFMGPFEASLPWSTENIIGSRRFIEKVWRLAESKVESQKSKADKKNNNTELESTIHRTVQKVTDDIDTFSHNTAVSALMIALNEMEKSDSIPFELFGMFLKIMHPFAPHVTEELWKTHGGKTLLVLETWPKADPKKMKSALVTIAVQINGKVRGEVKIPTGSTEKEALEQIKNDEGITKWLGNGEYKKVIFIQNRLINIVI